MVFVIHILILYYNSTTTIQISFKTQTALSLHLILTHSMFGMGLNYPLFLHLSIRLWAALYMHEALCLELQFFSFLGNDTSQQHFIADSKQKVFRIFTKYIFTKKKNQQKLNPAAYSTTPPLLYATFLTLVIVITAF